LALSEKGVTKSGEYWITSPLPQLPVPTYDYIGRFFGTALPDGSGGYGNEMNPINDIWDGDLDSFAQASISGWAVTQSTVPAGIEFDYGAEQDFTAVIKYGVNGFYADGNLQIFADGELVQSRDFDSVEHYTPDVFTVEVSNFQKLKFVLEGDISGLGPHPNFNIYEIYPKISTLGDSDNTYNINDTTNTYTSLQECNFNWGETEEFAGASCEDLAGKGVTTNGYYYITEDYNGPLQQPAMNYVGNFYGYEPYHIWDQQLSTSFSATAGGGNGGVVLNYVVENDFPVVVRYGVNAAPGGHVKVYLDNPNPGPDDVPAAERDFPTESEFPDHLHEEEYSGFTTISFMLSSSQPGAYPQPTLKIYEIYPKNNLGGNVGSHTFQQLCDFSN
jgi:hypothetical protein